MTKTKKRISISFMLLIFLIGLLPFINVNANPKKVLAIQHWKIQNGATVYFVRATQLPMLDVRVIFSAGSAYDGDSFGLANLTNSMLGEGTQTRTVNQIAIDFDQIGAEFNTVADRDKSILLMRTLSQKKYLSKAINLFSEVLTKPTFPQQQINRVKGQVLAGIKLDQQNPSSVADNQFYQMLYSNFPYAHPPAGTLASVPKITRQQIINFYKQYYVASNADLVLVGDVSLSQAKQIAKQILGNLPKGVSAKSLHLASKLTKPIKQHIQFNSKQSTIMVGQVGITRENKNYFPLVVGNHILGGGNLTSLLYQQIREKYGLAYYAVSEFVLLRYRGPYIITLQTKANQTKQATQLVDNTLKSFVKNGPTAEELKSAKLNIIGSFPLGFDSNNKIAAILGNIAFYKLPLNYLDTYRQNIQQVTLEQIKNAFLHEIHLNKMAVLTVGPNNT